ncbi:hypothetical protein AGMMS50229_04110 [Campylobacterota bacterium]|nr:hypothetical protein AGMMS50229_04110 [Campylobacterota bacterium]
MRYFACFVYFACLCFALDETHLNSDITTSIDSQKGSIEAGRKRQKYDFLGEVRLSGSISENRNDPLDQWRRTDQATVSFSQDIFRSGGIIASMDYADLWAAAEILRLRSEINGYLLTLSTALLQAAQDRLRLEQNDLSIKNSEITLLIKQTQYQVGEADITQLNDAIQNRNTLNRTKLDLKNTLTNRYQEIAKISWIDPETFAVPHYPAIDENEFLQKNIKALSAKYNTKIASTQHTLTRSNYLPTIALNASYGRQKAENSDTADSMSYGVQITVPLSFTSFSSVEEKRADSLKKASDERTAYLEAKKVWLQSQNTMKSTEESIKILRENILLFDSLINATSAQVKTGSASRFDLDMLNNSKRIDEIEIELNKIAIEIERAKLFYAKGE